MRLPDNECFRINTMGSYNIIEAACKLGIKKIILASSITTYGVTYAEGDLDFPHYPVTEETPTEPMDVYATSKVVMERIGHSFAKRFPDVDIYALRIAAVVEPEHHHEKLLEYSSNAADWKCHLWSLIDARDLGNIVERCLQTNGLGFQAFNAVNDEITNDEEGSTEAWLRKIAPRSPITRTLGLREAPFSNKKAKELLGFREEFPWREVFAKESSGSAK